MWWKEMSKLEERRRGTGRCSSQVSLDPGYLHGANILEVSGSGAIRDKLRMLAGTYLQVGVDLVELDYQPM